MWNTRRVYFELITSIIQDTKQVVFMDRVIVASYLLLSYFYCAIGG